LADPADDDGDCEASVFHASPNLSVVVNERVGNCPALPSIRRGSGKIQEPKKKFSTQQKNGPRRAVSWFISTHQGDVLAICDAYMQVPICRSVPGDMENHGYAKCNN
jgi:hypothetical protein